MATLKLRNCTAFPVKYWRDVAGTRRNSIEPGGENTYKWAATYTLCAKRADEDLPGSCKQAVNQAGTYYTYWQSGKLHIFDEKKILHQELNEDNRYLYKWRGKLVRRKFTPIWKLKDAKDNTSNVKFDYEIEFSTSLLESFEQRETFTKKHETSGEWTPGGSFSIEGLGSLEAHPGKAQVVERTEHTKETKEHREEQSGRTEKVRFSLPPGAGFAVWQAWVDLDGNLRSLPFLAFTRSTDRPPKKAPPPVELDIRDLSATKRKPAGIT